MELKRSEHSSWNEEELQSAYEHVAEAYLLAAGRMLEIAADPACGADAFVLASREVDQIWAKLCDVRGLLLMKGVAPKATVEQRLQAVRLGEKSAADRAARPMLAATPR